MFCLPHQSIFFQYISSYFCVCHVTYFPIFSIYFFIFFFFSNLMPVMYVTGYRDVCPPLYFSFSFNVFILFSCNCTFTHQTFMIFKTKTKLMIKLNLKNLWKPCLFLTFFVSLLFFEFHFPLISRDPFILPP